MIVFDTNVLIYAITEGDPHHQSSRRLVNAVVEGVMPAGVFLQNLLEFFAVVTNPRRVARALTSEEALLEIANLRATFQVISPRDTSLDFLSGLVDSTGTTGPHVFDAFIAAQMKDAGIDTICTYNGQDFAPFPVRAVTPEEVLGSYGLPPSHPEIVHDRVKRGL
ncbi:MAG TPA: PIN domain-containing protein [Firmicutes bacterium]|nr:PIN domain-containing protein [Candidatus Fermentithermobacillaceae bacterium]